MRAFINYIALLILTTIILLIAVDIIYTCIYSSSSPRNKVQLIMNSPPKHYDIVIIGSSRAENHIIMEMFKEKGLSAYNFGMSGANLCENSLLLKLFFEKGNSADKIMLQLDSNYQDYGPSEGVKAMFLPYLPFNQTVYNHFRKYDNVQTIAAKYVPMYRYCIYDAKIGFREMLMLLYKKPAKSLLRGGFIPLKGAMSKGEKALLYKAPRSTNPDYDEIVATCIARQVPLIRFSAPFCQNLENPKYFKQLQVKIPGLIDYSNVIKADSLFASCGHLNERGAKAFTSFLLKSLNVP